MGKNKRNKAKARHAAKPVVSQAPTSFGSSPGRFWPLVLVAFLVLGGALYLLKGYLDKKPGDPSPNVQNKASSESTPVSDVATQAAPPVSCRLTQTDSAIEADDPTRDGWDTEAFNLEAGKQLSQIGKWLIAKEPIDVDKLSLVADQDVLCESLVPQPLREVYRDGNFIVERAEKAPPTNQEEPGSTREGLSGLASALRELADLFAGAEDVRYKFKVFRVEPAPNEVTTGAYFAISGRTPGGMLEQNATWRNRWIPGSQGKGPRLKSIAVEDFEQVRTVQDGPLFSDCTASIFKGNECYEQQLMRGFDYWADRIHNKRFLHELGEIGIAIGDANGDGLEDVYICQRAGLPNRLLLQQPDGTLRDVSREAEVDWLHSSRAALFLDLDNDGDQDLVVGMDGGVVIAENTGTGRFTIRTALDTSNDTQAIAAADYDLDGKLDLYVCGYKTEPWLDPSGGEGHFPSGSSTFVYHDANTGAPNHLFRNEISAERGWHFREITRECGLDVDNRRFSFAAAWEDFDNDGDFDLYVANDYGKSCLYRNDLTESGERHFVNVAEEIGALNHNTGMSVSWADFNRDGWMDLYVANMWSSAGNRITYQPRFRPGSPEPVRALLQHFAKGNALFRNRGDGTFADHTDVANVAMGRWAFASNFMDVNNDGWPDIVIANGFVTNTFDHDL